MAWLYNSTRGSVVIAMIFHASIDAITLAFVFRLFSDVDQVRMWWLLAAVFSLAYGFSWLPSLIEAHGILPLGPLVAALIVTAIIGRWTGVKSFLGRVGEGAVVVAYAAVWAAAQRATSVAHRERMGSETAGCPAAAVRNWAARHTAPLA